MEEVFGKITVDKVENHLSNKEKMRAQIRQTIERTYPSARIGNSFNDSAFDESEFNLSSSGPYTEKRVAWIDVPKGSTVESVQERLDSLPKARIYRWLRCIPIITPEERSAMLKGLSRNAEDGSPKTVRDYARQQAVVYETGEPVLYNENHLQFRRTFFSVDGRADIDQRDADVRELKLKPALEVEFRLNDLPVRREETREVENVVGGEEETY
jgi:hypothetical protein